MHASHARTLSRRQAGRTCKENGSRVDADISFFLNQGLSVKGRLVLAELPIASLNVQTFRLLLYTKIAIVNSHG